MEYKSGIIRRIIKDIDLHFGFSHRELIKADGEFAEFIGRPVVDEIAISQTIFTYSLVIFLFSCLVYYVAKEKFSVKNRLEAFLTIYAMFITFLMISFIYIIVTEQIYYDGTTNRFLLTIIPVLILYSIINIKKYDMKYFGITISAIASVISMIFAKWGSVVDGIKTFAEYTAYFSIFDILLFSFIPIIILLLSIITFITAHYNRAKI